MVLEAFIADLEEPANFEVIITCKQIKHWKVALDLEMFSLAESKT